MVPPHGSRKLSAIKKEAVNYTTPNRISKPRTLKIDNRGATSDRDSWKAATAQRTRFEDTDKTILCAYRRAEVRGDSGFFRKNGR
jgi:hypothetical protein